ncbi:MAG TPA: bacterioferritin [Thermogutta sp.]|nr:bacterioferritin [Thermogutta sp.]HQF13867.1 bacterioferritin [Thermogutta sp.]
MKGDEKILKTLNELLKDELTAIVQYVVHAEMCADWGYERLHEAIEKRSRQEMKHAESLIERIIFLEGTPIVSQVGDVHVGPDVQTQLQSDLNAEMGAIQAYNKAIQLAMDLNDSVTRDLLESIAKDEDDHINWIEEQLAQIEQMGLPMYLTTQTKD